MEKGWLSSDVKIPSFSARRGKGERRRTWRGGRERQGEEMKGKDMLVFLLTLCRLSLPTVAGWRNQADPECQALQSPASPRDCSQPQPDLDLVSTALV